MRALISLLVLLGALDAGAAAPARVVIVRSDTLGPYASAVAGFTAECRTEIADYDLKDDPDRARTVLAEIAEAPPSLVLALGPLAANAARRALPNTPIVFAMVPNYEKYGLSARNVTGIALSRPVRAQLESLKGFAPSARKVGVLYNPKFSQSVVDSAAEAARSLGLQLVATKVDTTEEIATLVPALAGHIDALWMIADRTVANAEAVQSIVRFTHENGIPLLALTEAQVRDGALVSLVPSYNGIGQQAGRLANRILNDGIEPGALAVAQPEGLEVAMNLATALKVGGGCDLTMAIVSYAAKHGYPIRAFE